MNLYKDYSLFLIGFQKLYHEAAAAVKLFSSRMRRFFRPVLPLQKNEILRLGA